MDLSCSSTCLNMGTAIVCRVLYAMKGIPSGPGVEDRDSRRVSLTS